jgi:YidC/Oxa1 family membrane protein insertase
LRSAVFVDTAPKINNPDYTKLGIEPLEFALRDQVGIRVDPKALTGLSDRLRTLLEQGNANADRIRTIRDTYIANFGESGKVGGRYILRRLKERKP